MSDKLVAITGATGYIGRHLVPALLQRGATRIKVLSRSREQTGKALPLTDVIDVHTGDLRNPESLAGFLEPGCTVINLVYLRDASAAENIAVTRNLLQACRDAKVQRLIHCSTADVAGRAPGELITEDTPCQPLTDYARTKLAIEQLIKKAALDGLDVVILRPTAVFGPGSQNLKKLADDLSGGKRLRNYLKACLFGRRRMNQVHVANVVAAIVFLMERSECYTGEVFIVSDDDSPANNFMAVESVLMRHLQLPHYPIPPLPLPAFVLGMLLRLMGKDNINPRRNYASAKLRRLGFQAPMRFEDGLVEYAAWYAAQRRAG